MRRILVVEDNRLNAILLEFLLEQAGYDVRVATTAEESLIIASEYRPDLILMDVRLPGLDGYSATRLLRAKEEGPEYVIFALTAFGVFGEREEALAAGCDGYLEKPIDVHTFIEDIARILAEE
jgi:two-component system cell cycle response regulator DivK